MGDELLRGLLESCLRFRADRRGSIALVFSLALLPLIGVVGVAVDFGAIGMLKSKMQAAADTGALQAGKELRLAQMGKPNAVTAIAKSYTTTALGDASGLLSDVAINAALINNNASIQVTVTATYRPKVLRFLFAQLVPLSVQATATSVGYPLCALALDHSRLRRSTRGRRPRSRPSIAPSSRTPRMRKRSTRKAAPKWRRARSAPAAALRGISCRRP